MYVNIVMMLMCIGVLVCMHFYLYPHVACADLVVLVRVHVKLGISKATPPLSPPS